jgi:3-hydroxyisobutyrate dehydrogenase-like beta-hydroxyacid dehydrogenase
MTTVAVIGLGRMGGPMACNIIDAGLATAIFDVSPAAYDRFENRDVRFAISPADAATDADVACVIVFDDAQTRTVVSSDDGLLSSMRPGSAIAIHSTISPETLRHLAEVAAERNVSVIDAGISGGEPGAAAGTLLTMVGGSSEAVEVARPALLAFSKEIIHAGGLGAGLALKLARNATGYTFMAAIHEAMTIATASGIALDVLQHTIAETGVFDQALSPFLLGGPAPLSEDAPKQLREVLEHLNSLGEKDLDQAIGLAEELNADLPVTKATRSTFHRVARL